MVASGTQQRLQQFSADLLLQELEHPSSEKGICR